MIINNESFCRQSTHVVLGSMLLLTVFVFTALPLPAQQRGYQLVNEAFKIDATASSLVVTEIASGISRQLWPAIQWVWLEKDPNLVYDMAKNQLSPQAAWTYGRNGFQERTTDFYKGLPVRTVRAKAVSIGKDQVLSYCFPASNEAGFDLDIWLPPGSEVPVFSLRIRAVKAGWFSAAFAGIESRDTAQLAFLYQPMIWSWRRFPDQSYFTPEHYASTATCFVNNGRFTEGISPDPSEIPFRFAHLQNSRYGFVLRNEKGKAQPLLFSPVPGGQDSYMQSGQMFSFKSRYVLRSGNWYAGLTHVLRDIFHYRNERQNAAVTLNQTIDNLISLAMNNTYGGWNDSLKGFTYEQDAIGTVKVVSALHQLGVAMVLEDEEVYRRRALPTISYMLSREKYLFSTNEAQKTQSPSYSLNGPCADVGELSGLHQLTGGRSSAFQRELNRLFGKTRRLNLDTETGGGTWQDYLHRYRVTRDPADLASAKEGADKYLQSWMPYPASFDNDPGLRDKNAAFLTDFTPRLYDLLELYEDTRHQPYLDMAVMAARHIILWTRSNPMAPDTLITVNEGGRVKGFIGKRYKLNSYDFLPGFNDTTQVQQEQVNAWQTSLVGLPPEQPGTYYYGPIMLTHHAAWFLRLAQLSGDTLLRDAAYNAVLGRYAGFPGYYFTSLHTNIYQKADYAMHPFMNIRYNAIFHNHIFPHINLLIDFLVNDARFRSRGQVDFPGTYAPGYAFLSSKVYGQQQGSIFGNTNIRLWLPPAALQSSSTAFNHLLGVGENELYVVLMNTSGTSLHERFLLNKDIIPWSPGKTYSVLVYQSDGIITKTTCKDGLLDLEVAGQQLVACKIEGLKISVPFPSSSASAYTVKGVETPNFVREEGVEGFGTINGMLINVSDNFSDAYIFTNATARLLKGVVLTYRMNEGEWISVEDFHYPYEFDLHLNNPHDKVEYRLSGFNDAGSTFRSRIYTICNDYP